MLRIFDDIGEGFISVGRFKVSAQKRKSETKHEIQLIIFLQQILKEIDEDFTDEELDEVIAEVSFWITS